MAKTMLALVACSLLEVQGARIKRGTVAAKEKPIEAKLVEETQQIEGSEGVEVSWFLSSPQKADKYKRTEDEPESFYPSRMSLLSSTPPMTGFRELNVVKPYSGNKKILVLGTSKFLLPTDSGKLFNTGHHTTESLVPLYHMDKVGFEFDFATEDGKPVAFEEWTFPLALGYEDELRSIHEKLKAQLSTPMKYSDVDRSLDAYAGVLIPGGHGPLIDMSEQKSLGEILQACHKKDLPTITLCHGPVALLSTNLAGGFAYKGYKLHVFPDKTDRTTPKFGYLPGMLAEKYHAEAHLRSAGAIVTNTEMDDTVERDRELVSGSSQKASQNLAEAGIKLLAERYGFEAF